MKIFVNIVSYKDPLLWDTVNDCINNCSDPSRLHFAIIDQSQECFDIESLSFGKQVTYLHIDSKFSRGPCWARHLGYSFYNNEDYILQVDAHTVFDKDWDLNLLEKMNYIQTLSDKCIISGYPQLFEIVENEIKKTKLEDTLISTIPRNDAKLTETEPFVGFQGYYISSTVPLIGMHIAGGFIFAPGKFVLEVPYDPLLYFVGEEQSLSVRAWTHGWDIYHVPNNPVYHLYFNKNRPLHWDIEEDKNRSTRWFTYNDNSKKRLRELLYENKDLGIYGLGKIRTLKEFAEFSGINYSEKTIILKPF